MSRDEKLVKLALSVLRTLCGSFVKPDRGDGTRLALRVLLPYAKPEALTAFWEALCSDDVSGSRRVNLRRAYAYIERDATFALLKQAIEARRQREDSQRE